MKSRVLHLPTLSRSRGLRRCAGAVLATALLLSLAGCYVVPVEPAPGNYGYHPWGGHHHDDDDD